MKSVYFCLAVAFVLVILPVSGLGINPTALPDKTLSVSPGETVIYTLMLENEAKEDIDVRFYVQSNVADVVDGKENYTLKANTYNTKARINITLSQNARVGSTYPVYYYMEQMISEELLLDNTSNYSTSFIQGRFDVLVVEKEEEKIVGEEENVEEDNKKEEDNAPFTFWDVFSRDRVFSIWTNLVIGVLIVTGILIFLEIYYKTHSKNITNDPIFGKYKPKAKLKSEPKPKEPEIKKEKVPDIPPEKYFRVVNGMVLKSIEDLKNQLFSIDDLSFDYHVNPKKNDFATWVEGVFKDNELADKLWAAHSKKEFFEILKDY
ncbi:MAG: OadG family protein [archaeon]